jgi:hypothetical protein
MSTLLINGLPADLPLDFSPTLSKKFFDVNQPTNKFNTISFGLTLPDTANNKIVFKNIIHPDTVQKFNKNVYNAILYSSNNEILKGQFFLDSINNGYEGNLVGNDLSDFFNLIKGKNLKDLESVESVGKQLGIIENLNLGEGVSNDIALNIFNQYEARSNPADNDYKGFIFPYIMRINKNFESPEMPINAILKAVHTFDELLPAFYIRDVLKLIALYADFTLLINAEIENDIKDLMMPYTGSRPFEWGLGTGSKLGHVYTKTNIIEPPYDWSKSDVLPTSQNMSKKGSFINQGYITYDCDFEGYLKIDVRAAVYNTSSPAVPNTYLSGTVFKTDQERTLEEGGELLEIFSGSQITTIYYAVSKGDRVHVKIDTQAVLRYFTNLEIRYVRKNDSTTLINEESYIDFGSDVPYAFNLPEMSMIEFLNGVIGLGYYLKINNNLKTLYLEKYETILQNQYLKSEDNTYDLRALKLNSYSLKPALTDDFIVSYVFDEKDGSRSAEEVYSKPVAITLPFAKTYFSDYLVLPNLNIPLPCLMTSEVKAQSRVSYVWEDYRIYEEWSSSTAFQVGDKVKYTFLIYNTPTYPINVKYSLYYTCLVNNTNQDPTIQSIYWEEDPAPYNYNSDISYDFKPRILRFVGGIAIGDVVSIFGSINFRYEHINYVNGEFFRPFSDYMTVLPKCEFDETIESKYITDINYKSLEGVLNTDTHEVQWLGYMTDQEWNSWNKGLPVVSIDGAKHLITEISQWNVDNFKAKGKAIKFVNNFKK